MKKIFIFRFLSILAGLCLLFWGNPAFAQKAQITGSVGLNVISFDETVTIGVETGSKKTKIRVNLEQTDYHLVYTSEPTDLTDQKAILVLLMY